MDPVVVTARAVTLAELLAVADGTPVALADDVRTRMQDSRDVLDAALRRGERVYGVNTGVGHARDQVLPPEAVESMQPVLVAVHAGAFGPSLPREVARAAVAARLVGLTRGGSGASVRVAEALAGMLNADAVPPMPSTGSVGAGDLGQLALVALAALRGQGVEPLVLEGKDGLALISANGVTLGHGAVVLREAREVLASADLVAATSLDAVSANPAPLEDEVQSAKGVARQADVAAGLRAHLEGSERTAAPASLQDPIAFRVVPQVHGAALEVLDLAERALVTELNARADNPLVSPETGRVIGTGNFHPMTLVLQLETLRLALAHVAQLSERRLAHLWQAAIGAVGPVPAPELTDGSPRLAGLRLRYAAAARYARIRQLAAPVSLDVPPLDAGQEDHATNAPEAVRATEEALDVVADVVTVELLVAHALLTLAPDPVAGAGTRRVRQALDEMLASLPPSAPAHDVQAAVKETLPRLVG